MHPVKPIAGNLVPVRQGPVGRFPLSKEGRVNTAMYALIGRYPLLVTIW